MWHRKFLTASMFLTIVSGCTSQPPIVSDPPQHERAPSEQIPWEEQYSRAMMRPEAAEGQSIPDIHKDQKFNGELQDEDKGSGAFGVVADVISFPFRAIGWLFQSVF